MAEIVVMPALGNTVESCLLTSWRVGIGDAVEAATPLAEIETDKSSMEVPAGVAGTVLALLVSEGDDVPVKQPIAVIGAPGEAVEAMGLAPSTPAAAGSTPPAGPVPAVSPAPPVGGQPGPAVSPRARHLAEAGGLDPAGLAGSGPHGRVIARDVEAASLGAPIVVPPLPAPVDVTQPGAAVPAPVGSGLGGRLTRAEQLSAPTPALPDRPVGPGPGSARPPVPEPGVVSQEPLTGVRQLIAQRMMASLANSAQVTYTATAPADRLLALRARFKTSAPDLGWSEVTVGDLVAYAAVRTLTAHPRLNSWLVDSLVSTFGDVQLGVAVDTPRGLLVPTVAQASSLDLRQLSAEIKRAAGQASAGSIHPDRLRGATFTVSNLGAWGVESFTPVLNPPQVAILGVGAIVTRAVTTAAGGVAAEQRIAFSLTADHRLIDGADAARYLRDLSAAVADIDLMVLGR